MTYILTAITTLSFLTLSYIFAYFKGKSAKLDEILRSNNELQKKYANNKNHINSASELSNKLQNGKY